MTRRFMWAALAAFIALAAAAVWRSSGGGSASPPPGAAADSPEKETLRVFWRHYHEATRLRTSGDFRKAAHAYQKSLDLRPNHEESIYYLGNCHFELGNYPQAASFYRRLIRLNPRSNRGFSQLGATLSLRLPGAPYDGEQARRAFLRASQLYPEESGPFLRLGRLALDQGRLDEALEHFEQAAGFQSPQGMLMAGLVHFLQGDYGQAAARFRDVLELQAREKRLSAHGARSEGDLRPEPGKARPDGSNGRSNGRSPLEAAAIRARLMMYWAAARLGGYPRGFPEEYRIKPEAAKNEGAAWSFQEATSQVGLKAEGLGPGAWADFDGDGDLDLAVATPSAGLALYRNQPGRWARTRNLPPQGLDRAFDLAWGDYDADGCPDLYVAGPGFVGKSQALLLRNPCVRPSQESFPFEDVTDSAGLGGERATARAFFVDLDADGRLDLLEAGNGGSDWGPLRLYRNQGDGTFRECAREKGLDPGGDAADAAVHDFDADRLPDILVLRWKKPAVFYRNTGHGFVDRTQEAGLSEAGGQGFSASAFDADADGYADLLFTRYADAEEAALSLTRPGEALATSLELRLNRAGRIFERAARGLGWEDSAFGVIEVLAADFNSDGRTDLLLANGALSGDRLEPSVILANRGKGRFRRSAYLPAFDRPCNALGAALGDFDSDGRPDVYLAGCGLFRNSTGSAGRAGPGEEHSQEGDHE